jgi:GTPase SAR1 family protein
LNLKDEGCEIVFEVIDEECEKYLVRVLLMNKSDGFTFEVREEDCEKFLVRVLLMNKSDGFTWNLIVVYGSTKK